MASKSRRQRRKQSLKDTGKTRMEAVTAASEPAQAASLPQTEAPAPKPVATRAQAAKPTPAPAAATAQYAHVSGELKLIGIIAAIMLAVLVVLSRVIG